MIRPHFLHLLRGCFLAALLFFLAGPDASGQTFIMADGAAWSSCSGQLFDSGGAGGDYGNSQNMTATLCPAGGSGSGPFTSIKFTAWAVQAGAVDQLFIHDGPTTASPLLVTGNGSVSLLNQTFTASDVSGCLTLRWVSDATGVAAGWAATILTGPDAGADGATTVCSTSGLVNLFSLLGGTPDAGGTWTAPGGGSFSGTLDPAIAVSGVYTYTVTGTAPCPSDQSTVTVTIVQAPDAGTNGAISVCSSTSSFGLFSVLGGSPDVGGTWTAPGGGASSGTFVPGTSPAGVYTYTVPGSAPCAPDQATVTVTVNPLPNAGTNGTTSVCSNAAPFSLFTLLGGTPNSGGSWTAPGGGAVSGTYTPGSSTPGTYTYTVTGIPPCLPASATVTVSQTTAPNAGLNAATTVCDTEAPFSLRSRLGGTPNTGGVWTAPGGGTVPDQFDPATGASGVYTYTVTGTAPCANATATLTVTVRVSPDAGTSSSLTVCNTGADVNLVTVLGGTPDLNGTWTKPGGTAHSGVLQPGADPSGTYTYTVSGQAPCTNAVSTVAVTVNPAPNAGVSANTVRCSDAANFSLRAQLGGTPATTGTWTGPGGASHPDTFDPGVDAPGIYTYTVSGLAPCANATATVNVTIIEAPQAGTNGTSTVCSSDAAFNLISKLGGTPDANGTWSGPGGSASNGVFTPGTSTPGAYVYTVAGTSPCVNDVSTVTVSVSQAVNPGASGSITLCSTSAQVDLFTVLGGAPNTGGTWTAPGGGSFAGTYNPANPAHVPGTYTYTVTAPSPCPNLSSTVQVIENQAPRAGTDGTITVCSTSSAFNLITALGGTPDANGAWLNPVLQTTTAVFTPGTSVPGVYRYIVPGLAPCVNDTALVTVVVNTAPNAGSNGSLNVCSNAAPVNLFTLLGGSPNAGGTWTKPGGGAFTGTYDPANATHPEGVYTYTVTGIAPCADATSFVVVEEETQPVAGTAGSASVCSDAPSFDLFTELGGTPNNGGTWTAPGGGASSGVFVPGTSVPGSYTYTVTGVAPCTNATAAVTVTVNQAPDAGVDGSLTVCSGQAPVDLFTVLGGTPDGGGTWSDDDNTGQLSGSLFDPSGLPAGAYEFTYTVPGSGQCNTDNALVTVTIVPLLDAGTNGTLPACEANTQVDLFTGLGGTPQAGGVWVDLGGTGALSGQFFNASITGAGVFQFRYRLTGTLSCTSDSATVTVTVVAAPRAGTNGSVTFCSNGTASNLFAYLGGSPQAGGTWRLGAVVVSGIYAPQTDAPGVYTYTVTGTPPCANSVASVTVSEVTAPNAGISAQTSVCSTDAQFSMRSRLGGSPSPLGTWTDPFGLPHGDVFQPGLDAPGVYIHTVQGTAPCLAASVTLTVTVNTAPYAGNSASTTVCSNAAPFLLYGQLGGAPAPNGTWTDPLGAAYPSGLFQPGTSLAGVYTYTVQGTTPCTVASATVTVFVVPEADAGTSTSVTFCAGSGAVNLFTYLGGSPSPTGTWTTSGGNAFSGVFVPGTTPPGTYTYTVVGTSPCSTSVATVTVAVNQNASAGISSSYVACSNQAAFALVDKLGGTPALNGTWTGPGGAASNGIFTPGTSAPGLYTYTVPGTAPCGPSSATVNVLVNPAANAGCAGTLTLCSTSAAANLFLSLSCSPQAGGVWRKPGNIPHSGTFLPSVDPPGVYTYSVAGAAPCTTSTATVTVTVNQVPNAGCNGLVTICESATPFPLVNVLGCSPMLNGTWTNPQGQAHNGVFIPGVDAPGGYTYTLPGTAPCPSVSAVATVVVNSTPDAGTDGVVSVCSDEQPFLLVDELGGTADVSGTWSAPGGASFTGVFVPGTSVGGVYTYVVTGLSPCVNDSAQVTVVQNTAPDAGVSTAVLLCSDQSATALVDLLIGTPDQNGTWTGPDGLLHNPIFVPGQDAPGTYTYTVAGFTPCVSEQASVQISLSQAANAGADGALTSCVGNPALDLFTGLGGTPDAGGTWSDDDNTGGLTGGSLNTTGIAPGTYSYTYVVPGVVPCPVSSAVVLVTVTNALDAGADSTVQVCESETAYPLFTGLGGTPQAGGQWVDVDGSGAMVNGVFNASVAGVGTFRFDHVLGAQANCPAVSATVTVQVAEGPYSGTDGFTSLCSNSGQVDMVTLLGGGPDTGGTWTDPADQLTDQFFTPGVDAPGPYTYSVPAVGSCAADSSVVTIQVSPAPNAGDPGTLTTCSNGASVQLFGQLQGTPQAGGTWTGPGSVPHSGIYNPAVDVPGVYTYTVNGLGVCPSDQAVVVVTENPAPFAGLDNNLAVCSSASPFPLITGLAGNPQSGGTWTGPGGAPHGPVFDPAVDTGGTYTYTVTGLSPCVPDIAVLTIQLSQALLAGADSTIDVCSTNNATDLFLALGADADTGGVWTDVNATGALTGSIFDATLVAVGSYDFIYTTPGQGTCTGGEATVTVVVGAGGDPGIGGTDTICGGITAYNLFSSLSGTPDHDGVWVDVLGTGALADSLLNASLLPQNSQYPFTYTVTVPGCGSSTSTVFISVSPFPDPGGDSTFFICSTSAPVDLFTVLGGTPDPGGTWSVTGGAGATGFFDPLTSAPGPYYYTVIGSGVCGDSTATVLVTINQPADAGQDGSVVLCNTDTVPYELVEAITGEQSGGVWTDLDGSGGLTAGALDAEVIVPGVYNYRYVVSVVSCASDTSFVEVTMHEAVTVSDTVLVCIDKDRTYTVSFTLSGGDPSSYVVTGAAGVLTATAPYVFTSAPIFDSQPYAITATDANGCSPITVAGVSPCVNDEPLYVPESFSPNGDGINDVLVIPGIEGFPGNVVSIYSRWGDEVYRATGYDNRNVRWDGTSENALIPGDLPTGTYYYVVEPGGGADVYKGFIYLNR